MRLKKNNAILKMESMERFYSKSELLLYNFINTNMNRIPNMTIKELSNATNVSEATIIRFTRKLGFDGFREFKLNFSINAAVLSQEETDIVKEIKSSDTPKEVFEKILRFTVDSLESTIDTIDDDMINKTVELIVDAYVNNNRIFLTGAGASSVLVNQFRIKLMRLNIHVIYFEDAHLQFEAITGINEDDLLIVFTTLGQTTQVLDQIDVAQKKKAKVVLITQFGNNELKDKADVSIYFSALENNLRIASQISIIVQSQIIDTIFILLSLKDLDSIRNNVKETKSYFVEYGYYK